MASVSGSQLTFLSPDNTAVNLLLSDGKTVTGATVAGAFNIEVFTVGFDTPSTGVAATALIQGAAIVSNSAVQAATLSSVERLGTGAYTLIDNTGPHSLTYHQAPQGETIWLGTGAQTVVGSSGDTVVGGDAGTAPQVIDLRGKDPRVTQGPMTASGGAGSLLVTAGDHDWISGGAGSLTVNSASFDTIIGGSGTNIIAGSRNGGNNSITGGSGTVTGAGGQAVNTLIVSAQGDTITGSSGSLSVQGGVGGATVNAGTGGTTVEGGKKDVINNLGGGTLLVDIAARNSSPKAPSPIQGAGTESVNLGTGHGATTLRDVSVAGGTGPLAATTVTGFSTAADMIASATSVGPTGHFLGASTTDAGGNTILSFADGSTMTLVGITNVATVTFIR
jgi:Ca2+-binding RTX toxin-like protein